MDKYTLVIIVTTIGFFVLAAALLVPIWRFLNSEETRAKRWTEETLGGDNNERVEHSPDPSPPRDDQGH